MAQDSDDLLHTPLHDLHLALGGKMVGFAGYALPVQYKPGVLKEHLHTRAAAGLFDVSHMGQVTLRARSGDLADAALALETLVPADILALKPGRQRYALFTNDAGGIEDDLMVANMGDRLGLVVNAACKTADIAHLRAHLADACEIEALADRALLALQGPAAESAMTAIGADVAGMKFMDAHEATIMGALCYVTRSGYTGEDGFEISIPAGDAVKIAEALLAQDSVLPVGLGARDSLRLESGLCLYGNDIDATTTPIEASLNWAIQKSRRRGGAREGGFPGASVILEQLETGPARRRVGIASAGRAPMRAGTKLFARAEGGEPVGVITSGGFGPSVGGPVSMGYLPTEMAALDTPVHAEVRGKRLPASVASLPFTTQTYKR